MQNQNWEQVKELLNEALALEPAERADFLRKSNAAPELLAEVESLLAFEEEAESLMHLSAVEFSRDFFDEDENNNLIGQIVGNYKIVREIGYGGMGAVYLAERSDGKFEQKVALKLLKREMNTATLRRRFQQEQAILASLEHPHIARLLDAGTTDDKIPFIAMEYVEGLPIDDFCHKNDFDLNQRLDLFRKVCAAVNFAHRNLVVHRDLKPSNILVNDEGTPKLLDFGISKIVSNELEPNAATVTNLGAMTPAYASPEQLQRKSVTTATDIYSLGVILYELLSGHRPFEDQEENLKDIYHAVLEIDPPPPSAMIDTSFKTLSEKARAETEIQTRIISAAPPNDSAVKTAANRAGQTAPHKKLLNSSVLRGDLDNIILKALRKEPERRYSSADNFAEDIHRHQRGLPVTARPNTFAYRAEKFYKRNQAGVIAGVLVLLAVVGGVVATLWQSRVAQVERAKAERRFNDVRALANSFLFEFSPKIENLPGSTPARELLVRRALEYLDNLSREASDDAELQRELAAAYEKVGDVQGNPGNPNLGNLKGALESYGKAFSIRQRLAEKQPENLDLQIELSRNLRLIGDVQGQTGEKAKSRETQEQALEISRRIVAEMPQNYEAAENLAAITRSRGVTEFWAGKNAAAVEYFRQAETLYRKLLDEKPADAQLLQSLAGVYLNIGEAQAWDDKIEDSKANIQKGLEIMIPLAEKHPHDNSIQRGLSIAYLKSGTNFQMSGNHAPATEMFSKGLAAAQTLATADPQNLQAQKDLAQLAAYLAASLDLSGKSRESLKMFEYAIEKSEQIRQANPNNVSFAHNLASTRFAYAETFETLKDYRSALKIFEIVRDELQAILTVEPNHGNATRDYAFIFDRIGKAHAHLAEQENRREHLQKALENQRIAVEKFYAMKAAGKLASFDEKELQKTESEIVEVERKLGS